VKNRGRLPGLLLEGLSPVRHSHVKILSRVFPVPMSGCALQRDQGFDEKPSNEKRRKFTENAISR
jgi:hypothetical protein